MAEQITLEQIAAEAAAAGEIVGVLVDESGAALGG